MIGAWWAGFVALVERGYVVAFLLGVIVMLQLEILLNRRQLRRNSETIRRMLELRMSGTSRTPGVDS